VIVRVCTWRISLNRSERGPVDSGCTCFIAIRDAGHRRTPDSGRGAGSIEAVGAALQRAINGIPSMSNSQLNLVHCVYCSASTRTPLSSAELESLLAECRRSNSKAEITGILLYQSGSFFQVLEGEQPTVEALFDKISLDKRHHQTKKIIFEPIDARSFAAWTMGFPKITSKELATIPGLNDFFHHGTSYVELGEGRAKSLLAAFKERKWRASLS
jgi:hypothetical protein